MRSENSRGIRKWSAARSRSERRCERSARSKAGCRGTKSPERLPTSAARSPKVDARGPPKAAAPKNARGRSAEIRLAEDPRRLLQAADLLFAPRRPLLPRHTGVHAHGLELLELVQRVFEDFLLGAKVSLSLADVEQRLCFLPLFRHLELAFLFDVILSVLFEVLELLLLIRLQRVGLRNRVLEVILDDLEKTKDARRSVLLPLDLDESGRAVERVQDVHRGLDSRLARSRVRNHLLVAFLLFAAELGLVVERLVQIRDVLREQEHLLRELVSERALLHVERVVAVDFVLRRVALVLRVLHVLVAPGLLVLLRLGLRLEARDEVLDHLPDLLEGSRRVAELEEKRAQRPALQL